jgi:hypothetical protein
MITATVLAVFFVPAFFVAMQGLSDLLGGRRKAPAPVEEVEDLTGAETTDDHPVPALVARNGH